MWVLERVAAGARFDPLIGDLSEQFAQGRSRIWYWRQALGALNIRVLEIARAHGPSFIVAIFAGWALNGLLERCCSLTFQPFYQNLAPVKLHPWSATALLRLCGMVGNSLFWCAICFASAWVVTRVHRAHQRAVLMVFMALQLAQHLPGIVLLVAATAHDPRLALSLATQIILTGLNAAFTLAAGLLAIRIQRRHHRDRMIRLAVGLYIGQVLVTSLLSSARRVGELSYGSPGGYLSLYALEIAAGLLLTVLLWRRNAAPPPSGMA